MNSPREICRKEKPLEFKEEIRWFPKGFQQPNTKRAISPATIDAFQTMICPLMIYHPRMEGHSGQKCNLITTCIPLDRICVPLDQTT